MLVDLNINEIQDLIGSCQQMLSFWADNFKEQKPYFHLLKKLQLMELNQNEY